MTSVLNHLPLLNGNKLLITFILIAGISSCASKKILASTSKETMVVGDKNKKDKVENNVEVVKIDTRPTIKEDSILVKPVIFDLEPAIKSETNTTTETKYQPKYDGIYNIAVLLPFNLSQIPLGQYVDDSTKQLGTDSKNAMEFYLGCQMAKEKFESKNLQANVYFLDDRNDSLTTASLFTSKPFPKVDYVIGPISYKNLKQCANLAKERETILISPFANSMYIDDNPYYYNANASLKSQYAFLLENISKTNATELEVLYDGQDLTSENISILKDMVANQDGKLQVTYSPISANEDLAQKLAKTDTISNRTFLIYSSKDAYIKSALTKIKKIKNPISVYTSNSGYSTKLLADVKPAYKYYSVSPYQNDMLNHKIFAQNYEDKFSKKPTEIAFQAYDIMLHLLNTLDKNVALNENMYQFSIDFDNTQTKFIFKPVLNKKNEIAYYDNAFMYLYSYKNGNFGIELP